MLQISTKRVIMKKTFTLLSLLTLLFLTIQSQIVNEIQTLISSDIAEEDFFGNAVAITDNYMMIGAGYDDDNGSRSGSVYVYEKLDNQWEQTAKLIASDGSENDFFGYTITMNDEWAFISSVGADTYAGKVYVFHNISGVWQEESILTASDATEYDFFGYAMDNSGEYVVIGAYGNDDAATESGAIYLFRWVDGSWIEHQKLTAEDAAANDKFGISVAMNNSFVVVGAPENANEGVKTGSVYLFHNAMDDWIPFDKLTAEDAALGDHFGSSVAIDDYYFVVGAEYKNEGETWSGAAYVYQDYGDNWEQTAKLTPTDPALYQYFGHSADVFQNHILIGGKGETSFSQDQKGVAYMFNYTSENNTWNTLAKIQPQEYEASDFFGRSVCMSSNAILIGAHASDVNYEDAGIAYVFDAIAPTITQQPNSLNNVEWGTNVQFDILAYGTNISYQWFKDGETLVDGNTISGALTNTLSISNVSPIDEGEYQCVLTGEYGSLSSQIAELQLAVGLLESPSASSFSIYPNPITNSFSIQSKSSYSASFVLYNSYGILVKKGQISGLQTSVKSADLASGIYFLYIKLAKGLIRKKIIKL